MRCVSELVQRKHARDFESGVQQYFQIAGKGGRIAGNHGNAFNFGFRNLSTLQFRAGARWIYNDTLGFLEFFCCHRTAEQVALLA